MDLFPLADPQKKHVDQEEVRNDAGHKLPTCVLALCEKKGLRQKELQIIAKTGFQMKIPDSAVKSYKSFFRYPPVHHPHRGSTILNLAEVTLFVKEKMHIFLCTAIHTAYFHTADGALLRFLIED